MTKKHTLLKGLLGATALTVFTAGNAHAQLTQAGTTVGNTFTLDYQVGGVDQPTIDNTSGTPGDPDGPTIFTVDRLIDLTVTSQGDNTVAPGATNEELVFSVRNEGNDNQAYALSFVEEPTGGTDTIDTDAPTSATPLVYYIDDGDGVYEPGTGDGAAITYDPLSPPELGADDVLWVVVEQDIPASATDGDQADISLVADTLEPALLAGGGANPNAGDPVTGDGDGNAIVGAAENVLADGFGTGNEIANAGDHSATGAYIIASADVNAVKTVAIHDEAGTGCTVTTGAAIGGYGIPGACVEYTITVTNTGSADATSIVVNDVLPDELEFGAASFGGAFTGGSFGSPSLPANGTDCISGACVINLTGATLPAPASLPGSTVGTVTIRATVK